MRVSLSGPWAELSGTLAKLSDGQTDPSVMTLSVDQL